MSALKIATHGYRVLMICVPFALLQGCGGNPISSLANDAGGAIGTAFECTILNCIESNTLQVAQIASNYTVTRTGSDIHVDARLSKGSSFVSTVLLSPGDSESATLNNQTVSLMDTSPQGQRMDYAGDFNNTQSQPTVTVTFARAGVSYNSTVVLPQQFAILSSNLPQTLTPATGNFNVQLGIANTALLSNNVTGNCTRVDGSSFAVAHKPLNYSYLGTVTGGVSLQISTSDLDTTLNQAGQAIGSPPNKSLVQTCNLQLTWLQSQNGSTSSGMSGAGLIIGQTSVAQQVSYSAQH